ncbi:hypothetical protein G6F56_006808 [Rhizopus delemar]|nr:hypothetical protein G6F56_006808 [Rhizopus delemar]
MENIDGIYLSSLDQDYNSTFGVSDTSGDTLISTFEVVIFKNPDYFRDFDYTVTRNMDYRFNIVVSRVLKEEQRLLWFDQSFFETYKRKLNDTSSLMKVVVAPITLYSDDTSGNRSKQYNNYDNYLMNMAAMEYRERTKRENNFFLCTSETAGRRFLRCARI